MKITIALLATLLLAGCFGVDKAPKACAEFAYQDVCAKKEHCTWGDTGCVEK